MKDDKREDAAIKPPGSTYRTVPVSARCRACSRAELTGLRYFSVGNGSVYRTLADDVYCRRCGHIGQPIYELPDATVSRPTSESELPSDSDR